MYFFYNGHLVAKQLIKMIFKSNERWYFEFNFWYVNTTPV